MTGDVDLDNSYKNTETCKKFIRPHVQWSHAFHCKDIPNTLYFLDKARIVAVHCVLVTLELVTGIHVKFIPGGASLQVKSSESFTFALKAVHRYSIISLIPI